MKAPIVEEVRIARQQHAAKFKFDLHAICEDLKKKGKKWASSSRFTSS